MAGASEAVTGYHHAQVTAPPGSHDEVRRFYGHVLNLPEISLPANMVGRDLIWFAVGDRQLHVSFEAVINRAATHAHLAYEVNDIAAYRRRLLAAGVALIEMQKIPGYDRVHVHDPFGNRIEIIGMQAK